MSVGISPSFVPSLSLSLPRLPFPIGPRLTKHAATTLLPLHRLTLHLLRNLDVDLEELADAAVEAYGFALVQVGLAVLRGYALLGASVY